MDHGEPVVLRTRQSLQLRCPSEAPKDKDVLVESRTDTEVKELSPQWFTQNKKQQDKFKGMNLTLKIVLEKQLLILRELQGDIEAALRMNLERKTFHLQSVITRHWSNL